MAGLFSAAIAEACSCGSAPLQTYYRHTFAVFSGRVLHVKESREKGYNGILAMVLAVEAWKGVRKGQVVTIATGYGGGDCGVEFKAGSNFLVFAERIPHKGWMTTNICYNTRRLAGASPDVDSLRRWKVTGRIPPDPPRGKGKKP